MGESESRLIPAKWSSFGSRTRVVLLPARCVANVKHLGVIRSRREGKLPHYLCTLMTVRVRATNRPAEPMKREHIGADRKSLFSTGSVSHTSVIPN